ncbi:SMC-Scp complex subunit ScpB [Dongia sp.]|uniref:SMC-Scp complex subunit ScpB n=1 Tax=Dongia sp. TaxID=1977262 RepID=UPI0035AE6EE1
MSEDRFETLRLLEAVLFAASEPLTEKVMAQRLPDDADVKGLLEELKAHYANRGVNLMQFDGRWAFRTAPDLSHRMSIERKVVRKLTRAAIETLAIIAYHQPVTRAEIEEIRGVAISKGTLDSLLEADWIKPAGRRETPGRPVTWATTTGFLEHFGLESCEALPGVEELRAAGLLDARSAISTLGTQGNTVLPPDGSQEQDEEAAAIELRGEAEPAVDEEGAEGELPAEQLAEERLADDAYEAELLARAEEAEETTAPFAPAEEHEGAIDPEGDEEDIAEDDEEEDGEESDDDDDGDDDDGDDDSDDEDDEGETDGDSRVSKP